MLKITKLEKLLNLIRKGKTNEAIRFMSAIPIDVLATTKDINGRTILMHAALNNQLGFLEAIYDYAKRAKLNVDAQDNDGNTAIMLAAQHAYPEVVRIMRSQFSNRANPNIKNDNQEFPLKAAIDGVLANKNFFYDSKTYKDYVQVINELLGFGKTLDRNKIVGQDILQRYADQDANIKAASKKPPVQLEIKVDPKKYRSED